VNQDCERSIKDENTPLSVAAACARLQQLWAGVIAQERLLQGLRTLLRLMKHANLEWKVLKSILKRRLRAAAVAADLAQNVVILKIAKRSGQKTWQRRR
jgi:hypothetical protein